MAHWRVLPVLILLADPTDLAALAAMAAADDIDELRLHSEALRLGSDFDGLQDLVDLCADSDNRFLVRAVGFPLAKAPWTFEPPNPKLKELVFRYILATDSTIDESILGMTATALLGLESMDLLITETEAEKRTIGTFLLHCLNHPDANTEAAALQLVGHLYYDRQLERVLTSSMISAVRNRILQIAKDDASEFATDLKPLREFLSGLDEERQW